MCTRAPNSSLVAFWALISCHGFGILGMKRHNQHVLGLLFFKAMDSDSDLRLSTSHEHIVGPSRVIEKNTTTPSKGEANSL